MPQLSFIHIQMIHSLFQQTSSIRSCRSLTYQHPFNQYPLRSKFSSSFSLAPCLPLPASSTTQVLPLSSDSNPSFASRVQPSQALSSQSSTAHSSPPASLSHHTCSPLAPAFASEVPHFYCSTHTASIYPSTFATSSHPSSPTLSLSSQTVTHSPHTLAQSFACHLLDNLVFFSCSFTFAHRPPALRNRIFTSSFIPTHDPSTLILSLSSMQKSRHSSFWSLLLSSNLPITSFIAFTPPSISSFVPTIVISSTNNLDPHLRCPGSCPSLPRLSQYSLVVDIEQDRGGRAALSQPLAGNQAELIPSLPRTLYSSFHANQSKSLTSSLSVHTFQATSITQACSLSGMLSPNQATSQPSYNSLLSPLLPFYSLSSHNPLQSASSFILTISRVTSAVDLPSLNPH